MEIGQVLKDTENSLRDFIALILSEKLGSDWVDKCGVSPERICKWKERKETESKRQEAGAVDERLIYYADFYDLKTIFKKHWQYFAPVFDDLKTMEVWLSEFEKLRDPDAHRRELLPHQKNLLLGISGELRTKIARYRSKQDTSESYYPRIEFASDNLGNSWKFGDSKIIRTGITLRPIELLEFIITASDPFGESIEYQCECWTNGLKYLDGWSEKNTFIVEITDDYVSNTFRIWLKIRSNRKYHPYEDHDDGVAFLYQVLPPK
jgi:Swt1-like HEPN